MKLPSVTRILDATMPAKKRAALDAWKLRVGEAEAERIRESAFARGRGIDTEVDRFRLTGECCDPRISKYLDGVEFIHHEFTVRSDAHKYQGRLDAVLRINGNVILVDFKGANGRKLSRYLEDYELQLGGYAGALAEMGHPVERACVVIFVDNIAWPQLHWLQPPALLKAKEGFHERVRQYYELR